MITGPPHTPFEEGQYHGILRFPSEYPFKPPSISMITPNGRFACNTRLCLSMSDYHPDTWNPAWSVATILTGLLSFMTGDESTTGSITTSDNVKKRLARSSKEWNNAENQRFTKQFPDLVAQNKVDVAARNAREQAAATTVPPHRPRKALRCPGKHRSVGPRGQSQASCRTGRPSDPLVWRAAIHLLLVWWSQPSLQPISTFSVGPKHARRFTHNVSANTPGTTGIRCPLRVYNIYI